MKKLTVSGYTMEQARRIIDNSPARAAVLDPDDTDYAALLELYRRHRFERQHPLLLISAAFSLGHAIGVRDERAQRNGVKIIQPEKTEIDAADKTIRSGELNRKLVSYIRKLDDVGLSAIHATINAMSEGRSKADAIAAGNAVLVEAGRQPVPVDAVLA